MKYLSFVLSDKTPVKFKIKKIVYDKLEIFWKYEGNFNRVKKIDLDIIPKCMKSEVEMLEELENDKLIEKYRPIIEEMHFKIKSKKRKIG